MFRNRAPLAAWKKGIALVVLCHFFAAWAMAASPALHRWVHHDADADDHDCAAVMVAHGGWDWSVATVACPPPAPMVLVKWVLRTVEDAAAPALGGSRLGRAPPRVA